MDPQDGRVLSNFVVQALRGEPITVYGKGTQTRSFCYVSDLIDGLVRMMEQDDTTGPVNLGNPVEISVLELAEKVIRATGSRSKVVHAPLPNDDPRRRRPDISLAKKTLGWSPRVPLDEGIERTVDYFRELLAAEEAAAARVRQTARRRRGSR